MVPKSLFTSRLLLEAMRRVYSAAKDQSYRKEGGILASVCAAKDHNGRKVEREGVVSRVLRRAVRQSVQLKRGFSRLISEALLRWDRSEVEDGLTWVGRHSVFPRVEPANRECRRARKTLVP